VIKEGKGYSSSSPDELALLNFAKYIGYIFLEKDVNNVVKIQQIANIANYKLLHTLEFSSERKRMSVIVEDPDGNLLLLCKGADDVLIQRSQCTKAEQAELDSHLYTYAFQGLRTLVLAYRVLDRQ
jgi:magnesium-transporting ATPase (P-type)